MIALIGLLLGFLSNIFRINYIEFPIKSKILEPESAFCAMMDENISPKVRDRLTLHTYKVLKYSLKWYPIHELSFLMFFLIPIIFLSFFYVRMILTIRRANSSNIRRSAYRGSNRKGVSKPPDHRKQTIRMLGQSRKLIMSGVITIWNITLQSVSWSFSLFPGVPSISSA